MAELPKPTWIAGVPVPNAGLFTALDGRLVFSVRLLSYVLSHISWPSIAEKLCLPIELE